MADPHQNRYQIGREIGVGGSGIVFEATDTRLGRKVAFKRLLPIEQSLDKREFGGDLLREARALSAFQHPNIVTVYDVGVDSEGCYIVMELLEGETLEEVARRRAVTPGLFVAIAEQCLEGLVAAHARKLLHRDLKPSNIVLTRTSANVRRAKILDFGLAKFSAAPALQTMDQTNSVLGSIYFMAPEQFLRKPLDARCDLYQLGCVLAFALTAEYPFDGDGTRAIVDAHLEHTPRDFTALRPDLPERLHAWIGELTARAPDDRPASAAHALHALRLIAADHLLPAAAPGVVPEGYKPRSLGVLARSESPSQAVVRPPARVLNVPPTADSAALRARLLALEKKRGGRIGILLIGLSAAFFLGIVVYALMITP